MRMKECQTNRKKESDIDSERDRQRDKEKGRETKGCGKRKGETERQSNGDRR
jgi:hypothetical protein